MLRPDARMSDCLLEGIPMQPQPATSLAKRGLQRQIACMVHNIGCHPPRVNPSSVLVDLIISETLLSLRTTAIELSDCDGKDGEARSLLTALHFAPLRCCAAAPRYTH